jgi:3-methyladenine DNA glycosylase AlkD
MSTGASFDAAAVVEDMLAAFREVAIPERAPKEKRYLKSELVHLGTSVPAMQKVCKGFLRNHLDLSRDELLAVSDQLWETGIHECRAAATELLSMRAALLVAADLARVEQLVRESKTWALVDPLAVNVVGDLVSRFPELSAELDRFATDEDIWVRRTALLAHLRPLREGAGDWDRFARYADVMLEEKEFFIRKAIGWVLRETGKRRPEIVYEWLLPRAGRASGVTVREAAKDLDEEQKEALMAAAGRSAKEE